MAKTSKLILSVKAVTRNRKELKRIRSALKKEGLDYDSVVPVLLQSREEIQGAMVLASRVPTRYSKEQKKLLASVGQQIAVAIDNERLYEITRKELSDRKNAEEKLKVSLREKEVLLKELHHRVKNNMQIISSLLNLQSRHIKYENALKMFRESQDRIKSMSLVHEKLYKAEDLARIDFAEYAQDLVDRLFHSHGIIPGVVLCKIDIKEIILDINNAIPCGLIINELISNCLKHAFPGERKGEIDIKMHESKNNEYTLIIKDNGIGVPQNFDLRDTKTLGLQLVNTLVEQLEGSVKLNRKVGTAFEVKFRKTKVK
jgi:two-component sensor histidine kinase